MTELAERGLTDRQWSLRRLVALVRTRTGVLALTTFASLVLRTASSVLLTRLLSPQDFGIVGIITAAFYMVTMVTDLGFQAFLVRHARTEERHFRDVLWTIHAKRGLALCVGVSIASPAIAWAFGKPVIALPIAVASAIFLINGLASLSLMTALRQDRARELSLLDLGLQIFQTICCVLLAFWWRDVWAMIAAMLLQSLLRAALSYVVFADAAQRPARDTAISREFLSFSKLVLMSSILSLLIGQSDKLVLGRLFTLDEFGIYAIAVTIAIAPTAFAESYVHRIVFPIYSLAWRNTPMEIAKIYYSAKRLASSLYAFGSGGLLGSAALLVALLYDPRYSSASTFLALLMISTTLRLSTIAASEFLTAIGDMKRMLRMNVVRLVWLCLTMPAAMVFFGPIGVVASFGLIELPALLYSWLLLRKLGVLDIREEMSLLAISGAGAGIGFIGGTEILRMFPILITQ